MAASRIPLAILENHIRVATVTRCNDADVPEKQLLVLISLWSGVLDTFFFPSVMDGFDFRQAKSPAGANGWYKAG